MFLIKKIPSYAEVIKLTKQIENSLSLCEAKEDIEKLLHEYEKELETIRKIEDFKDYINEIIEQRKLELKEIVKWRLN